MRQPARGRDYTLRRYWLTSATRITHRMADHSGIGQGEHVCDSPIRRNTATRNTADNVEDEIGGSGRALPPARRDHRDQSRLNAFFFFFIHGLKVVI